MKMTIRLTILLSATLITGIFAQPKFEATNAAPGAFSRMGFLPRGISMGNAISAVTNGQLSPFYNPSAAVFQNDNSFQSAYSFLTLDRTLNFVSFTRRFDFYSPKDTGISRVPRAAAGLSAGIINFGISDIGEYDNQGFKTSTLSTSENLFFVSFANKFSKKLALGATVKIYYYNLYDKVTSTGTGFDIGAMYTVNDNLHIAAVITDLNSKYKWDTSPIYGTEGTSTMNSFPVEKKIAASYNYLFEDKSTLLSAVEFAFNDLGRKVVRAGAEYTPLPELSLRAGLDNVVLNNFDELLQPSAGFCVRKQMCGINTGIEYAFVVEQYSNSSRHIIGLSLLF